MSEMNSSSVKGCDGYWLHKLLQIFLSVLLGVINSSRNTYLVNLTTSFFLLLSNGTARQASRFKCLVKGLGLVLCALEPIKYLFVNPFLRLKILFKLNEYVIC